MSMLKVVIHNIAKLSTRGTPNRSRSAGTKLLLSSEETAEGMFLPKARAFCNSTDLSKNEAEVIKHENICRETGKARTIFDFKSYMLQKIKSVNQALDAAVPPPVSLPGQESMAMLAACGMEMIHAMCMMHDDLPCMDNDDLRRGKLSHHKVYGESLFLAGYSLVALAFEHMATATNGVHPKQWSALLENLKIDRTRGSGWPDFAEAATIVGAMLGGASDEEINRLRKFSQCLGLLFQVVDDILDVTKSSEQLGKTAGKDLILTS
ncbi:hypothetical protein HAX54_048376 [Datura stramonium]|uniref:Uncharacterized protein n=1 Tax=Datura stramonium TaxID=4076 RepID=A0ABS8SU87_DATST|nr:hypothetical protein [Datura stramonium]